MVSKHAPDKTGRSPGRPREFNIDAALDAAIGVFRERGYHATSIGDLSGAMGLATGSIYKAFPDKRAIFVAAFQRYTQLRHAQLQEAMTRAPSGRDKVKAILDAYVASSTGIEGRTGCLVTGSAVALSTFDAEVAGQVRASVRKLEHLLESVVKEGQHDGSIAADSDPAVLACSLVCLVQGFRIVGKVGFSQASLRAVAEQVLRGLS